MNETVDNQVPAASASARRGIGALLAGTVFGLGLAIAQMTDPLKVLAFLDVTGAWDASLVLVLGGAVVVALVGYHFVLRRSRPLFDGHFRLNSLTSIDAGLVAGATLFGVGWGLGGYCPGPAIGSLGFGNPEALWFLPAMLAGAGLQRWVARRADAIPVDAVAASGDAR